MEISHVISQIVILVDMHYNNLNYQQLLATTRYKEEELRAWEFIRFLQVLVTIKQEPGANEQQAVHL